MSAGTRSRAAAPDHVESVRAHLIDLLDEDDLAALTAIGEKVATHFGEGCIDAPATVPAEGQSESQSAKASPVSRS